jgi:transposase-like protein
MNTRKHYSPAFKAQVVQELLREEKTVSQLAAEHGIHPTQLHKWRSIALEGLPSLFSRNDSTAALKAEHAEHVEDLYAQIGRLTTQLAWLKRKTGLEPGPH